ncbi:hypothetical protein ABER75_20455 [Niallia taxi]
MFNPKYFKVKNVSDIKKILTLLQTETNLDSNHMAEVMKKSKGKEKK